MEATMLESEADEFTESKRVRVCSRCGMEKPCERENGREVCACCSAAINAGEPMRVSARDHWDV